jgi:DNA-binding GntR family transcriptional regulator
VSSDTQNVSTKLSPPVATSRRNAHEALQRPELLKNRAYEELKSRILLNEFPPGSFLAERQLAHTLGMSKTPVKAALERLELEGFIAVSPQQGIVVRELNVSEIADQYEIRTALECFVARSIAGHLRADQVARLEENLSAQKSILEQSKVEQGVALDAAFHIMLAEFLGNQEILRVMKQLREKIQRVVLLVVQASPQRIDTSYAEHRAIADAVIQRQPDQAARLIEEHLERGRQLILAPRGR